MLVVNKFQATTLGAWIKKVGNLYNKMWSMGKRTSDTFHRNLSNFQGQLCRYTGVSLHTTLVCKKVYQFVKQGRGKPFHHNNFDLLNKQITVKFAHSLYLVRAIPVVNSLEPF